MPDPSTCPEAPTPAQAVAVLRAIQTNYWNWDYTEFCRRLGLGDSEYARDKFTRFAAVAVALNAFDGVSMAVITSPPTPPTPGKAGGGPS